MEIRRVSNSPKTDPDSGHSVAGHSVSGHSVAGHSVVEHGVTIAPPALSPHARASLSRVGADLWRVVDHRGLVIGHLQFVAHPLGVRYRARHFHPPTVRFRDLGDFWSADDAVECLHHAG